MCDFKIKDPNGGLDLLECKRIHPEGNGYDASNPNSYGGLVDKIHQKSESASDQLSSTQKNLSLENANTHLLMDISQYSRQSRSDHHPKMEIEGFSEGEVSNLKEKLEQNPVPEIDRITLCWTNKIFMDNIPCALVQYSKIVPLTEKSEQVLGYDGWTIEGYPANLTGTISELRVSSSSHPSSWIKYTYCGLSDNLVSWGPEETRRRN
ncbi:hypothetical protein AKJ44_02275 [candidate division MSBL1 archaeon SCGC-AAA261F17]|uniref:Uncharacterized protein n=1 Tax=candidate division MSBL1 archaeon SCGC-AAA261F17 TaxID=1698274 RepID=A0A133V5F5_9EURY|nr:hypothetical protein AKJ44_02275 [candidate division MSBL1 archaeon SCGC-AAA261F17]